MISTAGPRRRALASAQTSTWSTPASSNLSDAADSVAPVVMTSSTSSTRCPTNVRRVPNRLVALSCLATRPNRCCRGRDPVTLSARDTGIVTLLRLRQCRRSAQQISSAWLYPRRQRRGKLIGIGTMTSILLGAAAPASASSTNSRVSSGRFSNFQRRIMSRTVSS